MTDKRIEAVQTALITISAAYNIKPTEILFKAWKTAIDNLTPDEIAATAKHCLKTRKSAFFPTPAEFIEIAEQLKSETAREKRIDEEIADANRYSVHDPDGKRKISELASRVGSEIGKDEVERPEFHIYEYMNREGETVSYAAYGEIPADVFANEVYRFYGEYPRKVVIEHKRFEKIKSDNKNEAYSTFVTKDQPSPSTQAFTVGYL